MIYFWKALDQSIPDYTISNQTRPELNRPDQIRPDPTRLFIKLQIYILNHLGLRVFYGFEMKKGGLTIKLLSTLFSKSAIVSSVTKLFSEIIAFYKAYYAILTENK